MRLVDNLLNRFTMYRVVLYGLLILSFSGLILSVFGLLQFSPVYLILSFALLVLICYLSNRIFARILKIPNNPESAFITALILFLILIPFDSLNSFGILVIAGFLAMLSKYILAFNGKHIFNPAAFGLFVIGIMGSGLSLWWVGSKFMLPVVLIVGILIVRKVRRFHLLFSFLVTSVISILFFAYFNNTDPLEVLPLIITSYPIIFLGTVMLTEPFTTPPTKKLQLIYGGIVGILSGAQFHIGPIFATPELALLIGNIFSFAVSFKRRITLTLKEKIQLSPNIYEFVFSPNHKFVFTPGQYLEWTLGHKKPDSRGIRRYFTISSSPSENSVEISIKIDPKRSSSYKKSLINLKSGDKLYAGQLAGDFVLPDREGKYVFIAGGIGITPFRSMIKNAIDKNEKLNAVLFYACSTEAEFVYKDLFDSAEKIGLKTVYVCSHPKENWKGIKGRIDSELIKKEVPDFRQRTFYLSGPNSMVDSFKKILRQMGVSPTKIITDYFSGY